MSPTSSMLNQQLRTWILIAVTVVSGLCCIFMIAWNWLPKRRVPTPVYRTEPIVNSVGFSVDRDSKYLAAVLSDGRVRLWETETKKELLVKLPSRLALHDLTWNIDGTLLTGGFEQHVLSWNVKSEQAKKLPMFPAQIVSLACRPGRSELMISLSNGQLYLVDARASEKVVIESGHTGIVKVVRFSPKGTTFVTAGADGRIAWHDWDTRKVTRKFVAHQHEISSVAFSSDGSKLVSGSWDLTAKVWVEGSEKPKLTLNHASEVAQVGWMGSDVVTTSWDEELQIWSSETGSLTSSTSWTHGSLAFAIQPEKRQVIGISANGTWHYAKP